MDRKSEGIEKNLFYREWFALAVFFSLLFALFIIAIEKERKSKTALIKYEETWSRSIEIELSGAVKLPGIYVCPPGTTLKELLVQAGGLSKKANRKEVPVKKILLCSQKIEIPFKEIKKTNRNKK